MRYAIGWFRGWWVVLGLLGTVAWGAEPAKSSTATVVDVVRLKSGRTLRGAIWHTTPGGPVTLVVRRAWFEQTYPDWARDVLEQNRREQRQAWEQLLPRLEPLIEAEQSAPRWQAFLKAERDRLQQQLARDVFDAEFLWVTVEAPSVARVQPATPAHQRLAGWAWSERLADVETRDPAALARQLEHAGLPVTTPPPDLSDRLPARPQDSREWTARLALLEYTYRQAFDMQGTGDRVFPVGSGQPPLAVVFPAVLEQSLQGLLEELAGPAGGGAREREPGWWPAATRAAEQAGVRACRVTRVQVVPEPPRATVSSHFLCRVAAERWALVWQATETADGAIPRPDLEARVLNDPQVKSALELAQNLGLGGETVLRQAVRSGAATHAAQQAVDEQFFRFRDRYSRRIDGPPLMVLAPAQ